MKPAKSKEIIFQSLMPTLFTLALGQAGCNSGDSKPTLDTTPEPQPTPKVETRTLHELAASDDTQALKQMLRLGQTADALNPLGQTPLHVAAIQNNNSSVLIAILPFNCDLISTFDYVAVCKY